MDHNEVSNKERRKDKTRTTTFSCSAGILIASCVEVCKTERSTEYWAINDKDPAAKVASGTAVSEWTALDSTGEGYTDSVEQRVAISRTEFRYP